MQIKPEWKNRKKAKEDEQKKKKKTRIGEKS